jgi:hypothetical protein
MLCNSINQEKIYFFSKGVAREKPKAPILWQQNARFDKITSGSTGWRHRKAILLPVSY